MNSDFPGFERCMWMMRRHDGLTAEEGFHALAPHAAEFVPELIAEFRSEKDHGLRCWLLELIGLAPSEAAFDLLVEQLHSEDESFRFWAVHGLEALDTKASRRALWEAGYRSTRRPNTPMSSLRVSA
jgi:hypothetical protein